jgi:hypothetical protein
MVQEALKQREINGWLPLQCSPPALYNLRKGMAILTEANALVEVRAHEMKMMSSNL